MPFEIIRIDITVMEVDAIVNAGNTELKQGGGVSGAIFDAAGDDELQAECDNIGHVDVGGAVMTRGYRLPSKFIIHTAGPVWEGGGHGEDKLLASCYTSSLELAEKRSLKSVAFPLISSGIYGYPKDKALEVAVAAIGAFLRERDMTVYLAVFDRDSYRLSKELLGSIKAYIDDNYADSHAGKRRNIAQADILQQNFETEYREIDESPEPPAPTSGLPGDLNNFLSRIVENFSSKMLKYMKKSGMTNSEIYKRANIDRKLFSKILKPGYKPGKNTVLALAVALELNLDETSDFLRSAGYALSPNSKFDLIVEYFILNHRYNILEINMALFAYDESQLGCNIREPIRR